MIVSLDIICCHSLGFCNVTGTFIYFKTIKLAIATTLLVNVHVPFNFTTWNKVVYTSDYVITYIIKTTEPNHLILILNLANKPYFIIKVNFCHLLAWFKNYDPLKVEVNSFWDTLYNNISWPKVSKAFNRSKNISRILSFLSIQYSFFIKKSCWLDFLTTFIVRCFVYISPIKLIIGLIHALNTINELLNIAM